MTKEINKLIKPYIVKQKNGNCFINIPLIQWDDLLVKISKLCKKGENFMQEDSMYDTRGFPKFSYTVKDNTPEMLKELAKDGWYPGRKFMELRLVRMVAPADVFPKDTVLVDIKASHLGGNEMFLYFGHKKFKALKDGAEVPIIGEIKRSKKCTKNMSLK